MTAKYFAILTNYGAAQLANAVALGTQMNISAMGAGDGGGTLPVPDPAQTTLIRENRRAAVNQVSVDDKNPNIIIAEQVIPENEGGWWIREIGLYDDNGGLIAVGNVPETYKPNLQEGSGRTQVLQMALIVSSTQAITLKVDPSVVLATREYVTKSIDAAIQKSETKAAKIYATKSELNSGLSGKQPTGDYATRTELNNGLSGKQPTGDYATKTEVGLKLDKTAVVHTTGTSKTNVISQDGSTKAFMQIGAHGLGVRSVGDANVPKDNSGAGFYTVGNSGYGDIPPNNILIRMQGEADRFIGCSTDGKGKIFFKDHALGQLLYLYHEANKPPSFGIGYRHKNEKSNRKNDTLYTNSSDETIWVSVSSTTTDVNGVLTATMYVDGENISRMAIGGGGSISVTKAVSVSGPVGPGQTVRVRVENGEIGYWTEFKKS